MNVFFLFRVKTQAGVFDSLRIAQVGTTDDKRLQFLIVAFCFGAMLKGAAGFGTAVAITTALLISLNYSPLQVSKQQIGRNVQPGDGHAQPSQQGVKKWIY